MTAKLDGNPRNKWDYYEYDGLEFSICRYQGKTMLGGDDWRLIIHTSEKEHERIIEKITSEDDALTFIEVLAYRNTVSLVGEVQYKIPDFNKILPIKCIHCGKEHSSYKSSFFNREDETNIVLRCIKCGALNKW